MKKIIISAVFIGLWVSLFAQITVETDISKNVLTSTLGTGNDIDDPGLEDLFFSISPNGMPQYGREVKWNLWLNTDDEVRSYRVRKGDYGRSAISDSIIPIKFNKGILFDPALTPDMDMKENWVKLSKAWNFSADAYTIVVLSIKNQGEEIMNEGRVKFDYPTVDLNVSEVKIYNEWGYVEEKETGLEKEIYTLVFEELLPGEVRHFYFYIDVEGKGKRDVKDGLLYADLLGHQQTSLRKDKTNPPHDPNGLTLVNALLNTPMISNCTPFAGHPVLEDACANGTLFWYDNQGFDLENYCKFFNGNYCDPPYSLNYPYCNIDQERLIYQMTCLNDGEGPAGTVIMEATWGDPELIESGSFATDDFSHSVLPSWNNPEATFLFEKINLPGLNDPEIVYMYDECSAQVTFSLDTKCAVNGDIVAAGLIKFYDTEGILADELATNTVTAVPEQGQYDNIRSNCINCGEKRLKSTSENIAEEYRLSTSEGNDFILISRLETGATELIESQMTINMIDISGRVIEQLSVPTAQLATGYRIDVSSLPSGIYILSGQNGESRFAKKFVH